LTQKTKGITVGMKTKKQVKAAAKEKSPVSAELLVRTHTRYGCACYGNWSLMGALTLSVMLAGMLHYAAAIAAATSQHEAEDEHALAASLMEATEVAIPVSDS
jgi:hypothetical protein